MIFKLNRRYRCARWLHCPPHRGHPGRQAGGILLISWYQPRYWHHWTCWETNPAPPHHQCFHRALPIFPNSTQFNGLDPTHVHLSLCSEMTRRIVSYLQRQLTCLAYQPTLPADLHLWQVPLLPGVIARTQFKHESWLERTMTCNLPPAEFCLWSGSTIREEKCNFLSLQM